MKKFILSLLLCVVGLVGFSSAWFSITPSVWLYWVSSNWWIFSLLSWDCIDIFNNSLCRFSEIYNNNDELLYSSTSSFIYCMSESWYFKNNSDYNCVVNVYSNLMSNYPECQECSEVNTWDILSWSCDTNYCVENDLCPVPSNFSQLFINDLEFPWKPLINIWIPDYITWDYSSTETWFDLYVGSGYDVDYINSIIDINSYRPSSEDFTDVFVNWLTLILPYIFIALLILFIWKLIKRVFK